MLRIQPVSEQAAATAGPHPKWETGTKAICFNEPGTTETHYISQSPGIKNIYEPLVTALV